MDEIWLLIIISACIALEIIRHSYYKRLIEKKVKSLGGEFISSYWHWGFLSETPYRFKFRTNVIYSIEYRLDNEDKEGWVKFGILLGPDWRL